MWKPVFTGVCETHGRSVTYNGGWFMGFAGVSEEVRLPAEVSTSAPGICCIAKPAPESRENPLYSASSVQGLVIQN